MSFGACVVSIPSSSINYIHQGQGHHSAITTHQSPKQDDKNPSSLIQTQPQNHGVNTQKLPTSYLQPQLPNPLELTKTSLPLHTLKRRASRSRRDSKDILGEGLIEAPTIQIILKLQATRMNPLEWQAIRDVLEINEEAFTDIRKLCSLLRQPETGIVNVRGKGEARDGRGEKGKGVERREGMTGARRLMGSTIGRVEDLKVFSRKTKGQSMSLCYTLVPDPAIQMGQA
ncbi:uncharacterized protein PAC_10255 [Phialocephala subalpina]|uniref:DUF7071 domain-containing protein n=1 Tax=Phialocephala subalpina TaxID=576137 RepID=A0A1L7X5R5_9HELO|nr:uncharacterized protein PAC_10255 [Phialocephala subalpina]